MVPTQESPRSSFSCPRWAWRGQSGTDGAAEWKYVPSHSKNEIQSRSQPVSFLATIECHISNSRKQGSVDSYRNQLAKNKAFSSVYFIFRRIFNGLVRLFFVGTTGRASA